MHTGKKKTWEGMHMINRCQEQTDVLCTLKNRKKFESIRNSTKKNTQPSLKEAVKKVVG